MLVILSLIGYIILGIITFIVALSLTLLMAWGFDEITKKMKPSNIILKCGEAVGKFISIVFNIFMILIVILSCGGLGYSIIQLIKSL